MLVVFYTFLSLVSASVTDPIILTQDWKSLDIAEKSYLSTLNELPTSFNSYYSFDKDSITYDKKDIWLLFSIENRLVEAQKVFLECYLMDFITLYELGNDSSWIQVEKSGYLIPPNKKPFPKTNLNIIPFTIAESKRSTYLLHIHNNTDLSAGLTKSTFSLGVKLLNENQAKNYLNGELLLDLFLGALLIMFIYNISFYFFTKFEAYLFFSIYNILVFTFFFFLGGYAIDFRLFTDMDTERIVKYVVCILANASYAPFTISFLKLKTLSKKNYWIQLGIFFTCLSSLIFVLSGKLHQALIINAICTSIMFISIPFAARAVMKKGLSSARFFLMGSAVVCIGIVFFYLGYFHAIDFMIAEGLFAVFSLGELAILSLMIGYEHMRAREEVNQLALKESMNSERLEFIKQQRSQLEDQLTSKKRELTAHVMRIANTNDSLLKIKQHLEESGNEIESTNSKKAINELEELIAKEDQWNSFTALFNEVHPDFYTRIEKRFPNLTTNELKLIGYSKMNLKSSEIASLLNVSRKAVTQANHRLRKKLGIPPDLKIITFLESAIEEE